ncbi:MAG: DUF4394 domain-containing protein [Paracoccaceae bacterium]|nr:MAG: DUF4394 domain-containing protein [Paracoccaceae bacterium]
MTRTLAALLATAAFAAPAAADTALGLAGDRTLVMIDTATAAVTGTVEVQGVNRLLGIDWRPGNMTVIGVTDEQAIVVIDPATGATTPLSQMNTMLPVADGMPVIVDVNPAADRLRFMSGSVNHRVNMDTGEVTVDGALNWEAGDANAAAMPMVAATAYINSHGKPEKTAMYNIDTGLSALLQQTAPNDGTNKTIGALGVTLEGPVAFDVGTTADGTNTAWLAAMGGLHTLDLTSGKVTGSWGITGTAEAIRDLTILPAM